MGQFNLYQIFVGGRTVEQKRILIVEDQPLFSQLLQAAVSSVPNMEVVGVAKDGEAALALFRKESPEAVLMDIELPGELDGIDTALAIRKEDPKIGVVFLSAHMESGFLSSLPNELSSGWAYLLKQSVPDMDTVTRAIMGAIHGMVVLDPELVKALGSKVDSAIAQLPHRHQQILGLVAEGFSNAAISRTLSLAEKTIETYLTRIYQSLGLSEEPDHHLRVRAATLYLQNV